MAVGLYEISRRREAGDPMVLSDVLGVVFRQKDRQIPSMAAVIVVFFLFWNFLAHMIFALFLGTATLTNITSSFGVLLSGQGLVMLLVGTAAGAVFATLLYALTVVSLPLLLDREVDFVTAMLTSFALVQANAQWQWPFKLGAQAWQYSGQWRAQAHRTPLAPQERFAIGGRHTVRGFDGESVLSADSGWFWRNEVSTLLGDSGTSAFAGLDHGQVRGPSAQRLVGTRLTGAVVGLRASAGALQGELFAGWPLHKPEGFRTAKATLGFWLAATF